MTLLRGPLFVTGVKKLDDKEERKHVVYPRFVWSEAHVHTYIRAHSHTDAHTRRKEATFSAPNSEIWNARFRAEQVRATRVLEKRAYNHVSRKRMARSRRGPDRAAAG